MAHMITAECINCNACLMDCPVSANSPGPSRYEINPDICIDCEGYYPVSRCLQVCPINACVPERASYLERAATLAARASPPRRVIAAGVGRASSRVT
jgi:ferredoxin